MFIMYSIVTKIYICLDNGPRTYELAHNLLGSLTDLPVSTLISILVGFTQRSTRVRGVFYLCWKLRGGNVIPNPNCTTQIQSTLVRGAFYSVLPDKNSENPHIFKKKIRTAPMWVQNARYFQAERQNEVYFHHW